MAELPIATQCGTAFVRRPPQPRRIPAPYRGTSPRAYIFSFRLRPSVYNSARFAGGEPGWRAIGGRIPDRSPGHAFVQSLMPAGAGTPRYEKPECLVGGQSSATSTPPQHTPTSPLDSAFAGDDEWGAGNDELGGRNDEIAEWRGSTAARVP